MLIQKLADVESIAQHFSKIAGHKTLVWFCDGQSFPFPPREGPTYYPIYSAMLALQRADMSLYPVSCFEQKAEEVNERLRRIASATGGRAYHDWTVLEHAIRDASDDVQNSFQLTWTPATMTHTGPVHELRIASNKAPSDALLYRSTYVETVLPHGKEARTVAVQFLLDSPLKVFGLPLRLDVRASGADQLNATTSIDTNNISDSSERGNVGGLLDLIYGFYDSEEHLLPGGYVDVVHVDPEHAADHSLLSFNTSLRIPAAAVTLKILVRDANSGAIGSATAAFNDITQRQ